MEEETKIKYYSGMSSKYCLVSSKLIHTPCEEVSIDEGEEIAKLLFEFLEQRASGIGLSANQLGINKAVCVVNVKEKLYFVNPKILFLENPILFAENCLSFPNKFVKTKRFSRIGIEASNLPMPKWYGRMDKSRIAENEKFTFDYYLDRDADVLEAVVIQHETAHTQGLTMYDFQHKKPNMVSNKTPKRNERIIIEKDTETKEIKYKKLNDWEKLGWRIKDGQINL